MSLHLRITEAMGEVEVSVSELGDSEEEEEDDSDQINDVSRYKKMLMMGRIL